MKCQFLVNELYNELLFRIRLVFGQVSGVRNMQKMLIFAILLLLSLIPVSALTVWLVAKFVYEPHMRQVENEKDWSDYEEDERGGRGI